jgi:hypothetical protein
MILWWSLGRWAYALGRWPKVVCKRVNAIAKWFFLGHWIERKV